MQKTHKRPQVTKKTWHPPQVINYGTVESITLAKCKTLGSVDDFNTNPGLTTVSNAC